VRAMMGSMTDPPSTCSTEASFLIAVTSNHQT
jgi:hypothetical protein